MMVWVVCCVLLCVLQMPQWLCVLGCLCLQEREELKALAEELGRELHQSKAQVGELRTETDYLNTQLEVYTYKDTILFSKQPLILRVLCMSDMKRGCSAHTGQCWFFHQ